ncbi:flagellar biosynthesis protein FlhF [Paenibacillus whitsoniae]|uniref:Flagellar biosynthesis protein FlhF n=1 Tax=Paenibacillus whitsoniae TaxID=2496558 RepID=A0A3S0C4H8_9BACL|nr:flagellar biosynthesis protein FlhF [Paenibacillus whitsoniae]RTE01794.1 flagellar biosynthesis protein FlhF [Paenibacillus whitsoniae]
MRVKRYVVDSMPDALQKIRTDLGKDAVILNTKEIRTGGFLGMFGKKKIEVIAAIDGAAAASGGASSRPAPSFAQQAQKPIMPNVQAPARAQQSDFPEVPDVLVPSALKQEAAPPQPIVEGSLRQRQQQAYAPAAAQVQAPTAATATATAAAPAQSLLNENQLMDELKQMKEMMKRLTATAEPDRMPEPLEKLEQLLCAQEVDPAFVRGMMEEVQSDLEAAGEPITEENARQLVRAKLGQTLHSEQSKHISDQTRVVHFVGPTGVGKTTTIAKLAADQVLKYHRKVGFITSDTYRIAAIEQLKTYATILNVPLEVVFSPQDLAKAFTNLADCDVIFMDTAGRNFRNEMYVSELNSLLKTQGKSETILVLSLTTKYRDIQAITNNFSKFKLDKVLFTKMDETDSYGAIVNVVNEFSLQLSYVTTGQNVPDDIVELNEWQVIDLLLEEPQT